MELDALLGRCRRLEERAAALYRAYAAASRGDPPLCALWTALAREEEEHAHAIARAHAHREASAGWQTRLDGWGEAIEVVDRRLATAESIGGEAGTAQQLLAALDLELSELDALRHVLLQVCHERDEDPSGAHALRLADAAARLSDEPDVQVRSALLRARARLEGA